MPYQLVIKKSIIIHNNHSVVYKQLQNKEIHNHWFSNYLLKDVAFAGSSIRCKSKDEDFVSNVEIVEPDKIIKVYIHNCFNKTNNESIYTIHKLDEHTTKLDFNIEFPKSINPLIRYDYFYKRSDIEHTVEKILLFLKNNLENIVYERYKLSNFTPVIKNQLVFKVMKQVVPSNLESAKGKSIDTILINRLLRYNLIDSNYTKLIKYELWTDSLVKFGQCIPINRNPTPKQLYWLRPGRLDTLEGEYLKSTFKGNPQDLSLAWDSIYNRLYQSNKKPIGKPLEELIQSNDTTEIRDLFIRVD